MLSNPLQLPGELQSPALSKCRCESQELPFCSPPFLPASVFPLALSFIWHPRPLTTGSSWCCVAIVIVDISRGSFKVNHKVRLAMSAALTLTQSFCPPLCLCLKNIKIFHAAFTTLWFAVLFYHPYTNPPSVDPPPPLTDWSLFIPTYGEYLMLVEACGGGHDWADIYSSWLVG